MKKLVALLLTATVAMSLVACGGAKTEETAPTEATTEKEAEVTTEAEETVETVEAEETTEVADEATANGPVFQCDWDKVVCTFGEDGSFKMELPEYQITEEGTWTANEDGTYTVTSPAGKAYTSYTGEDGLVHLDYVADASEQLVAQLYIK